MKSRHQHLMKQSNKFNTIQDPSKMNDSETLPSCKDIKGEIVQQFIAKLKKQSELILNKKLQNIRQEFATFVSVEADTFKLRLQEIIQRESENVLQEKTFRKPQNKFNYEEDEDENNQVQFKPNRNQIFQVGKNSNEEEEEDQLSFGKSSQKKEQEQQMPKELSGKKTWKQWSHDQNKVYLKCLNNFEEQFSPEIRRKARIFQKLSKMLKGSKTGDQCRGHHRKMLMNYRSIDGIKQMIEYRIDSIGKNYPVDLKQKQVYVQPSKLHPKEQSGNSYEQQLFESQSSPISLFIPSADGHIDEDNYL